MSGRAFTDEERIARVWDVIAIKNLMARRAYLQSYELRAQELDELWAAEPEHRATASYGENGGYQVGMDAVRAWYVDRHEAELEAALAASAAKYPELGLTAADRGVGRMQMRQLTSPYIEIAGDGETAQGLWYVPGQDTAAGADGVDANWVYGRLGADFVKEDGVWKIWHVFEGTDFVCPAGADFTALPVPAREPHIEPEMTLPMAAYTSRNNYALYPAIPSRYEHFSDPGVVSNGPEGNPNYRKEAGR